MFEGRLKIFLIILVIFVLALLARAVELQVFEHDYWSSQAAKSMEVTKWVETSRGTIYDAKGNVLARDEPCVDACVDYRAIVLEAPPEPNKPFTDPNVDAWASVIITKRVKDHIADQHLSSTSDLRKQMYQDEKQHLIQQVDQMWSKLADLSGQSRSQIDELRKSIQKRVEMRKRIVAYQKYQKALQDAAPKENPPWYRKWIIGEATDVPGVEELARLPIAEEQSTHMILEAIDTKTQNELQKHADDYPGLTVVPSTHRFYPCGAIACQVIGRLGKVQKEDLETLPKLGDDRAGYTYNDDIGRDGLEALGEPTLRGKRGKNVYDGLSGMGGSPVSAIDPEPGGDLYSTIDIDLEAEIQDLFTHVEIPYGTIKGDHDTVVMHGAAVVIDVDTGDVKALVSYPDYDLNDWEKLYPTLVQDNLNAPLRNRATQSMFEPGSTVKPVVGAGAITQGVLGVNEGIECTGFLKIDGRTYKGFGKCWTVAVAKRANAEPGHHTFPTPHRGHDGNADGFLTYSDALERSCNVFFETVAYRLKLDGLTYWMKQFGLGRPTGIGLAEVRGRVPDSYMGPNLLFATCTSGIGQSAVAATPLQMCNVAATIARRGIWMRPNIVKPGYDINRYRPKNIPAGDSDWDDIPSRMDLHIAPAAIDAAYDGMKRVVNDLSAGTGTTAFCDLVTVAGKTGTAQASPFMVAKLDEKNQPILDADGKPIREPLNASTHEKPDPNHPWYRSTDDTGKMLNHAWFIGFVPADHPKYAISVMVEYGGGGGGVVAGPIARKIVYALIAHQYLQPESRHSAKEPLD